MWLLPDQLFSAFLWGHRGRAIVCDLRILLPKDHWTVSISCATLSSQPVLAVRNRVDDAEGVVGSPIARQVICFLVCLPTYQPSVPSCHHVTGCHALQKTILPAKQYTLFCWKDQSFDERGSGKHYNPGKCWQTDCLMSCLHLVACHTHSKLFFFSVILHMCSQHRS